MMGDMGTVFLEHNHNSDSEASDLTPSQDPAGEKLTSTHETETTSTVLYDDRKPFFPSPLPQTTVILSDNIHDLVLATTHLSFTTLSYQRVPLEPYSMTKHTFRGNKRTHPDLRDVSRFINPSARPIPTYSDVFTAKLTTLSAIDTRGTRQEQSVTVSEMFFKQLQRRITLLFVNFHERDIPPKHRDPVTFQILHNLACERNRLDND